MTISILLTAFVFVFLCGYLLIRRMRWMFIGQYQQTLDTLDEFILSSLEGIDFKDLLQSSVGVSLLNDLSNYHDEKIKNKAIAALSEHGTDSIQKVLLLLDEPVYGDILRKIYGAKEEIVSTTQLSKGEKKWTNDTNLDINMLMDVLVYFMSGVFGVEKSDKNVLKASSYVHSLKKHIKEILDEKKFNRSTVVFTPFDYAFGELENDAFDDLTKEAKEEGIEYFLEILESLARLFQVRSEPSRIEQLYNVLPGFSDFFSIIYENEKTRGLPDQIEGIFQKVFKYIKMIDKEKGDEERIKDRQIIEFLAFREIGNNLRILADSLERVYNKYK